MDFTLKVMSVLTQLFVFALFAGLIALVVLYIIDITQKKHAIRRNFPVIGRFRYLFEHLGEFFRQYFFAMDREELPFNRAERSYVYRSAKGENPTIAFGSTRDMRPAGTLFFVNCPFPTLSEDLVEPRPVTLGPNLPHPYTTDSFFNVSAMSYGAISRPAVLALSNGARKAGCWLNTGEGGLSPYHLEGGADLVFQIGTAKYGVRDAEGQLSEARLLEVAAHEQVKMFEIKLSQGAKPGKGGILPAAKVTSEIAKIRFIEEGQDSISPNRHVEVNSIPELLDLIATIRQITGKPTGIKFALGTWEWLDQLLLEINARGPASAPDFMTVDSGDGGSGAAPMSLMDYVGLSIRESLPLVIDALRRHGLKDRIFVAASGKLITPGEVAWALSVGADFVVSARGFMFALGCIQAMQCNKNTCPTGVTTHDQDLQKGLDPTDKAERVYRYATALRKEVGVIAHSCGVADPRQLQRSHCRVRQLDGGSLSLDQLYARRNALQSQIELVDAAFPSRNVAIADD